MIKSTFAIKLSILWVAYAVVITATVIELHRAGLGYLDSTKDAVVWAIVAGLPILFTFADIGRDPSALKGKLLAAIQFTAFVEFFVNLYVFPLWVELVVQIIIALIGVMVVVSELDAATLVLKRLLERLLVVMGLAMLVVVCVHLLRHMSEVNPRTTTLSFAQPIVLTGVVVGFTYAVGLVATYERAFMRIGWKQDSRMHRARAKAALVLGLHVRIGRVHGFTGTLPWRLADTESWSAARQFVCDYKFGREQPVTFDTGSDVLQVGRKASAGLIDVEKGAATICPAGSWSSSSETSRCSRSIAASARRYAIRLGVSSSATPATGPHRLPSLVSEIART